MSVSLNIDLDDGAEVYVVLSGQYHADTVWATLAKELGLKHYDGTFPIIIDPSNIDEVLPELRSLESASRSADAGDEDQLQEVIQELEKVRGIAGWSAMIG